MSYEKFTDQILKYINNDNTEYAIMLTAPWGTGKSYYINEVLIDEVNEKTKKDCILISLYGLNSIQELSKNIFFECKLKKLCNSKKKQPLVYIAGKTIIKNLANYKGIDLSLTDKEYISLCSSITLKDKFLIFEDVERSSINIIELLGFVNNLCEQEKVKILLVANENEIKTKQKEDNQDGLNLLSYTNIKEKTIRETIKFNIHPYNAILSIMSEFDNEFLNMLLDLEDEYKYKIVANLIISEIMNHKGINDYNLRSFKYACQKTIELCECFNDIKPPIERLQYIFFSTIAFCLRKKKDESLVWNVEDGDYYSSKLGTEKYPLARVCYDYLNDHYLDKDKVKTIVNKFIKNNFNNDVLNVLYKYYISTEQDVLIALQNIPDVLLDSNYKDIEEYIKIVKYLISVHAIFSDNVDIDSCKEIIINKLSEYDCHKVKEIIDIPTGIALETCEEVMEYEEFKEKVIINSINNESNKFKVSKDSFDVMKLCDNIRKNSDYYITEKKFITNFNFDDFVDMIFSCTSKDILELSGAVSYVYSYSNIKDYLINDKKDLELLNCKLQEKLKISNQLDRIVKLQIENFISNIKQIIKKLS